MFRQDLQDQLDFCILKHKEDILLTLLARRPCGGSILSDSLFVGIAPPRGRHTQRAFFDRIYRILGIIFFET